MDVPRIALLALFALGVSLPPQEAGSAARQVASDAPDLPPPRTEYMGRPVAATMHWRGAEWLLRETREEEEGSTQLLDALALEPGQVVCDLGCGVGYLTLPIAERVGPEGRVLAVDVQPEMLAGLAERVAEAKLENIEPVLATLADPRLEPGSCDVVLMVDVYHELGYPERVLEKVRAALKPGGRLVLVEFRAEDRDVPIKPEHKMSRDQLQLELPANGFRLASDYRELPWQHMLSYVRDDEPAPEPSSSPEDEQGAR